MVYIYISMSFIFEFWYSILTLLGSFFDSIIHQLETIVILSIHTSDLFGWKISQKHLT